MFRIKSNFMSRNDTVGRELARSKPKSGWAAARIFLRTLRFLNKLSTQWLAPELDPNDSIDPVFIRITRRTSDPALLTVTRRSNIYPIYPVTESWPRYDQIWLPLVIFLWLESIKIVIVDILWEVSLLRMMINYCIEPNNNELGIFELKSSRI